jgi:pimeloyl-ACP methyl ester carboxylesterase
VVRLSRAQCLEAAQHPALADDPPRRLRLGKAGQYLWAEIGEIEQPADLPARRFADDERVRRGKGLHAAEMMVRSTARFSHLVLVDPLGIKIGGREERIVADMHALSRVDYLKLAWADPAKGDTDFAQLSDAELTAIVRAREAFVLYGWKPYMHNPRLKRWLHRVELPTLLLWGADDRIVTPQYGEGWRQAIPGARLEVIPKAGHFPHWEQPETFVERLSDFVDKSS